MDVGNEFEAGIAWYVIDPTASLTLGVDGTIVTDGFLAVEDNNVTYPTIAVTAPPTPADEGKGIMAFSLMGEDHYPSAAFTTIDATGVGAVQVISEGVGPHDGFTAYKAFVGDPPRTRWGDYGAAWSTAAASGWRRSTSGRPARWPNSWPTRLPRRSAVAR